MRWNEQDQQDLREAHQAMEEAIAGFPGGVSTPLRKAALAATRLRDRLIDRLRTASAEAESAGCRAALGRVNEVLSLVVGMQYPQGSVKKPPLEQARDLLAELLG